MNGPQIHSHTSPKSYNLMTTVTMTEETPLTRQAHSVVLRLTAAGFYGCSSFLIVVVNKIVLTSYK